MGRRVVHYDKDVDVLFGAPLVTRLRSRWPGFREIVCPACPCLGQSAWISDLKCVAPVAPYAASGQRRVDQGSRVQTCASISFMVSFTYFSISSFVVELYGTGLGFQEVQPACKPKGAVGAVPDMPICGARRWQSRYFDLFRSWIFLMSHLRLRQAAWPAGTLEIVSPPHATFEPRQPAVYGACSLSDCLGYSFRSIPFFLCMAACSLDLVVFSLPASICHPCYFHPPVLSSLPSLFSRSTIKIPRIISGITAYAPVPDRSQALQLSHK